MEVGGTVAIPVTGGASVTVSGGGVLVSAGGAYLTGNALGNIVQMAAQSNTSGGGGEESKKMDYNQAQNKALEWLKENYGDFKAEKVKLGKFGPNKGKPIGMQTEDGKAGFRVEYDSRSKAHINVWSGKKDMHIYFEGTEETVNQIVKQFVKE